MRTLGSMSHPSRQYAHIRNTAIGATALISLVMIAMLLGFQMRSEAAVKDALLTQARAHALQFNAVRAYVQGFSGIYVPGSGDVRPSEYLQDIDGIVPAFIGPNDREYVLQNSPIVAREVARVLEEATAPEPVHMSLHGPHPINSENTPDEFAITAMERLETGEPEVHSLDREGGTTYLRYALAISATERCGLCHEHLVGKEGQLAGVSVVRMDVTRPITYLSTSRSWTAAAVVLVLLVGAVALYVFITQILDKMHVAQTKVYEMARKDSLTGLATRRVGVDALTAELERARRENHCVACCIVDLDDFKAVNDTLGHTTGDLVLASVGTAIGTVTRPYDVAARVGGEEFLLILPGACAEEAERILARMRDAVSSAVADVQVLDRPITCSAGIAVFEPGVSETPRQLYIRADSALLIAKNTGKDRNEFAAPPTGTEHDLAHHPISAW